MNKHLAAALITASTAMLTVSQAEAVVIESYFGWNYITSNVTDSLGNPILLPQLALNSITYTGGSGTTTQTIADFGGPGSGMPDGEGFVDNPTFTTTIAGDGETTRTVTAALPIDWIEAGVLTPWGQTYSFPTISITGITAFGVPGSLTSASQYVVGLIPFGVDNELDSTLGGVQGDIYDAGRIISFSADPLTGIIGSGDFTFAAAAASPVPIPAAVWLFGSGLLGLIGVARRRRQAA
jgi:hypothetical protein